MPKPRKVISRPYNERILILCEGTETEPRYFNGIKSDRSRTNHSILDVEVYNTKINTGKELVGLAKDLREIAEKENNEYDHVWIVINKDGYKKHPQTFDRAKALDIKIAFSSISFEYWFLLHFEPSTKPFPKADDLIKHLKAKGYKDYDKKLNHYEVIGAKTETALQNAEKIRKSLEASYSEKIFERNPYTDVDKLVSYLLGLPKKK